MKVSLNLIKQLTRVKLGNQELLGRINSRLAEVESVENLADRYQGIVVAQINEAKSHPNADKLGVYQVDNGKKVQQVVAGDKTLKVGDKVAYIAPGLIVPSTFYDAQPLKLKKVSLRGEDSNGMLGSARELDFGDEHGGVLKLDTDKPAGTTLIEAYDLDDRIIEVENKTLTHRPDCFGMIGFAREVAGIQDLKFTSPKWLTDATKIKGDGSLKLNVKNEIQKECPTYLAVAIRDVKIQDSPVQLMSYLNRLDIRPINNVVDMTNYYMLMTGQPLHAFDYDKVQGKEITVRYPKKGEKLTLLDNKQIELGDSEITICDSKGPIALGGVMGGAESEVSDKTKNIIIECANFDMYSIRATSMKHGIFSDAATRFMRGQSPELSEKVLAEVLSHLKDYGKGKIASNIEGQTTNLKPEEIFVDFAKINELLGTDMPTDEQKRRLNNVELEISSNKIIAPYWRRDLHIWQDIAEEVGRLSGFDNIVATTPMRSINAVDLDELEILKQKLRQILVSAGANEILTYSGVSLNLMERVNLRVEPLYRIRNSLSPELEFMRASLLPTLLSKVHLNHRRGSGEFALFEIGKTHRKKDVGKDLLPVEYERLGFVFSADKKTSRDKYQGAAYYQAMVYLEYILQTFSVEGCTYEKEEGSAISYVNGLFTSSRRAKVMVEGKVLGVIGEFTERARTGLKLPEFCSGFELDVAVLGKVSGNVNRYIPLPRFPGSEHDVTLMTDYKVSFAELSRQLHDHLLRKDLRIIVTPTDVYQKNDHSKSRNITFRLSIVNTQKTMSTTQVNAIVDNAVGKLETNLGVKRI